MTETPRDTVTLAHGAGGRAMRELIEEIFLPLGAVVDGRGLEALDDGAALRLGDLWLVVTTDSHAVHPTVFPGGDIGRLAVCGTVNDLAMMGATAPLALTCAVIIEEGFALERLRAIRDTIKLATEEARAPIVTGDTKVMGKGELDGIVINTTGIGLTRRLVTDAGLSPKDRVVVTGTMGDHGLAVLAARHDLGLKGELCSDVAPLNGLIELVLEKLGDAIVALKDPTRGGLTSALSELASKAGVGIVLEQERIPVSRPARAAAELLGIDPFTSANEGKAVIGVRAEEAERLVAILQSHPLGRKAAIIGEVVAEPVGMVVLDTGFGRRMLFEPEGLALPRIC